MQAAVQACHESTQFSSSNNAFSLNATVLSGFVPLAEKYTLNVPPKVDDFVCFYLDIVVLMNISFINGIPPSRIEL